MQIPFKKMYIYGQILIIYIGRNIIWNDHQAYQKSQFKFHVF